MPAAHPLPPPPASKCGCGVCPAPQARAKRAPRATRATPAQAFRAPLRRKKRGLPLQQARRAIAPFARSPVRRGRRSRASRFKRRAHRTPRAQAFRVSEGHKKRVSPHPPSQAPRSHPPRTTRQRFGEPQLSKLKSESSDMRGGFGSLASARPPYAGRRPASPRHCRRRSRQPAQPPSEKIGARRAFPTRAHQRAFASLYTPSHHRIGNWITAAMAAVYSTHTSARPKCPPSRATPLKYT